MKIIIDTNIVFSAIINPRSAIGDLIINSGQTFSFVSTEFLMAEIDSHSEKILNYTGLTAHELQYIKSVVFSNIRFYSEAIIPFEYWKKAAELVRGVDMKDISFVCLTLFLNGKLWSGDKKLSEGLRSKGFSDCITTQDLFQSFKNNI